MKRLLVLDFDGTMTDAEVEGAPFRRGYLEDVAAIAGAPLDEVLALADRFEDQVRREVGAHGWVFGGHIVAPASVDPYLRVMPVARMVLDALGAPIPEPARGRLLEAVLFKYNYPKTATAFRPGAGPLLRALGERADLDVWIVTNSHTEPVQNKLRALGARPDGGNDLDWLIPRVRGRAQKYVLDPQFDAVPESLTLPGLDRPVMLRRRAYHAVLDGLRAALGVGWDEVRVYGDIFELDLALPLALGASVALAANAHTPAYERAYLSQHPRARLLGGPEDVLAWLG